MRAARSLESPGKTGKQNFASTVSLTNSAMGVTTQFEESSQSDMDSITEKNVVEYRSLMTSCLLGWQLENFATCCHVRFSFQIHFSTKKHLHKWCIEIGSKIQG
jgi:hypothetical protein